MYNDPAKLLKVCLYARDEYDHLADETPASYALVTAGHAGVRFKTPEVKILKRENYRLAKSIYGVLSPSDLRRRPRRNLRTVIGSGGWTAYGVRVQQVRFDHR